LRRGLRARHDLPSLIEARSGWACGAGRRRQSIGGQGQRGRLPRGISGFEVRNLAAAITMIQRLGKCLAGYGGCGASKLIDE
jgi:hypothetical protein